MAEIERSAAVADPFVRMDWRDCNHDRPAFEAELKRHYEAGRIILLDHPPFEIDFDVLNRVSFPAGRLHQKLTDRFLAYPKLHRPEVRRLFHDAFGLDLPFYLRFRREVIRLSEALRRFARDTFVSYRFLRQGVSWRFTPTGPEGLHVDYFRRPEELQYLRIFINVDRQPRVWTIGPPLEELIERYADETDLLELAGAPSNQVCQRLNKRVFDKINVQPRSAMDRHIVSFAPGDVWLCETRLNSHEIFSGHRLVATDFYVEPASMRDPQQSVDRRVTACLHRLASARSPVAATPPPLLSAATPASATAAPPAGSA